METWHWILFLIYCIPAIIAWLRDLSSRTAITILSLLNALFLEATSIFGLFFGLILLIWSAIGRSATAKQTEQDNERILEQARKEVFGTQTTSDPDPHQSAAQSSLTEELLKLAEMKDKGLLTEAEFEAAKKKVLEQN